MKTWARSTKNSIAEGKPTKMHETAAEHRPHKDAVAELRRKLADSLRVNRQVDRQPFIEI
jgi:hypothetical protein